MYRTLFDYEQSLNFLRELPEQMQGGEVCISFIPSKLLIQGHDLGGQLLWSFRPPLVFPRMLADETLAHYNSVLANTLPDYLILLLRANGNASIAHCEQGRILNHKVIRKYMVRQKQGKSQLKHLKTKGKSRAGSRIRLQQTQEFAQEINQKLLDWEVENVSRILVSTSIPVWNLLFSVQPLPPFEKRDTRLRKIPYHVNTPNHANLKQLNHLLGQGMFWASQV